MANLDKYNHKTDQELLEDFRNDGNNEWLGILLQRYTMLLLGVCMKYLKDEDEARDSVQQIFLKVIQELGKYKVDYFKSWLYMVAKNHCLMILRERQRKGSISLNEDLVATPAEETDIKQLEQTDLTLELVQIGLKELNSEQQQCVILFYLEKRATRKSAKKPVTTICR
ncbi:MAG: sigma-70 family RNA polymerase sigma factor [Chitinophagaceae bacterium]|nr:sigma-70 family RNA polymerase sigma factor [Chitinophagaceae bacterium]